MTAVCLASWAYQHRNYIVNDKQLVMSQGTASVEETTYLDWSKLYADGIVLLLVLVGMAIAAILLKRLTGRFDQ